MVGSLRLPGGLPATLRAGPERHAEQLGMSGIRVDQLSSVTLECMEIWGGNDAVQSAISMPGIDAWIFSHPFAGGEQGGDVHYVSTCGHGEIDRFAVFDVSGHGDSVSNLSGRLRSLMRKHINKLDQTRIVRSLNNGFVNLDKKEVFATGVLASYHAPTDHLVIVNAGHPAPLWYRAKTDVWRELRFDLPDSVERLANLPLGIIDSTCYHQFAVKLDKGDLVLIYTDAIVEAESPDGELLGPAGLLQSVKGIDAHDPGSFCSRLLECVATHRGHNPPDDDLTVLLLHHNAADPPKQKLGDKMRVLGKMLGIIEI